MDAPLCTKAIVTRKIFAISAFLLAAFVAPAGAQPKITSFDLANGMQVVIIPDHRAPVVTHMVWYRVGAADDPWGRTGLAHFLEHLMFKQTASLKTGEFTRIVNRLGGRHNALTTHDTTVYFQRVAKEHLQSVMTLEADRMANLRFIDAEVTTERNVVSEERRSSVDANPISMLNEQMLAQLYLNHPYGRPVLGWAHEIAKLNRDDAQEYYKRHYAPNNAILVIAGDVTDDDVRTMANATYGRVAANPAIAPRVRIIEPTALAPRWVRLEDPRAGAPLVLRFYDVPSLRNASGTDGAALILLAKIMGGDDTSRFYRRLVVDTKLAAQAGVDYQGGGSDGGRLAILALASSQSVPTAKIEDEIDRLVSDVLRNSVSEDELVRAKLSYEAEQIFLTDSQERLARRFGEALTVGRSLASIISEPERVAVVTVAEINRVAEFFLAPQRSVTGTLVKPRSVSTGETEPSPRR